MGSLGLVRNNHLVILTAAEKDTTKGMGSGWERFEFNKDAPLDDEEVEG